MISGPFETHLTIETAGSLNLEELQAAAGKESLKLTIIELSGGEYPAQNMVTRHGDGELYRELETTLSLCSRLAARGWPVSRVKVEVAAQNACAPRTAEEAQKAPADRYFENHVKILRHPGMSLTALEELGEGAGARLSRNARRTRVDGLQERFFTQRFHNLPRDAARRGLILLLDALGAAGVEVLEQEEEYVIHDSNLRLDAGWMDAAQPIKT